MKKQNPNNGCGERMPPTQQHVRIYFDQKGLSEKAADGFYQYYKFRRWKTDRGCPIRNWKVTASNWIWMYQQNKPLSIDIKVRLQFPNQIKHNGRQNT